MLFILLITILCFFSVHSYLISEAIVKFLKRINVKERRLLCKREELKNELSRLSMVNDFVKYSKLQRAINAIEMELQEGHTSKFHNNVLYITGLRYLITAILAVFLISITIYYRRTPMFILNDQFDLFPFSTIISYPNGVTNAVSLQFWIVMNTSVFKRFTFKKQMSKESVSSLVDFLFS